MAHEAFLDLIDLNLDAGLGTAEAARLASHVKDCGDCRTYQATARRAAALLAAEPRPQASEAFVASVMRSLPSPAAEWSFLDLAWAPAMAAALAAGMLMLKPPAPALIASAEDPMVAEAGSVPELEDLLGVSLEDL